jgi:hypothetical protein
VSKAEKLLAAWREQCPPEVPVRDFGLVIEYYLESWLQKKKTRGSHLLIVEHPALALCSSFAPHSNFSASVRSGRRVKGIYVLRLLKAIDCIEDWEANEREERLGR